MNGMLDPPRARAEPQRRFVSDTSHELRSPVASIRQHAEVALAHPERTTASELAETVLAEDLRVQRLVDDLFSWPGPTSTPSPLRARPVDLDDLVFDEARRSRASTGASRSTRRACRPAGSTATRTGCGACCATSPTTPLVTRAAASPSRSTEDGDEVGSWGRRRRPGDRASRPRARLRALRAPRRRTGRDTGGSGLGLAIVAELVAAHEGTAVIGDSALGGTMVEIPPAARGGLTG